MRKSVVGLSERKPTRSRYSRDRWVCIPKWLMVATLTAALAAAGNRSAVSNESAISDRLSSPESTAPLPPRQEPSSIQFAQAIPAVTYPVLEMGSTGETVSQLQATLKLLGFYQGAVDGSYSASTQSAVALFQTAAGLAADGVTGPSTWRKLLPPPEDIAAGSAQPATTAQPPSVTPDTTPVAIADPPATAPSSADPPAAEVPSGPPILRPNFEGSAVAQLQRELTQLGYYSGPIDGTYGELTQLAVKKFQADQQLEVDAIVGPSTWDALTRALG